MAQDAAELQLPSVSGWSVYLVKDASDPIVADFLDLKDPGSHLSREGSHFIVEGPEAIRLLLASRFVPWRHGLSTCLSLSWDCEVTQKVLLKASLLESLRPSLESADRKEACKALLLLCDAGLMERITCIPARHASAALALAERAERQRSGAATWKELLKPGPLRALALKQLDEESVGALFRVAAAFGVDVVLLDSSCGDPFHRRSVRVSMGQVLRVPCAMGSLEELLPQLLRDEDVDAVALCEDEDESCVYLDKLSTIHHRWVCLIGAEGNVDLMACCRHRVAIQKVAKGVSLGVAVASSIMLNGLAERDGRTPKVSVEEAFNRTLMEPMLPETGGERVM
ncbi:unnamed protein product [Cladocopium goreaui]|uniref:NAD-dependent protein deacetylase sirtuin-2 n=1 Tax=Cladocopium goreaui TaxID=2562237 RepID=A0A9P1BJY5_9DINO|nr:unnamed protein product [Cladocopium goreaui]